LTCSSRRIIIEMLSNTKKRGSYAKDVHGAKAAAASESEREGERRLRESRCAALGGEPVAGVLGAGSVSALAPAGRTMLRFVHSSAASWAALF